MLLIREVCSLTLIVLRSGQVLYLGISIWKGVSVLSFGWGFCLLSALTWILISFCRNNRIMSPFSNISCAAELGGLFHNMATEGGLISRGVTSFVISYFYPLDSFFPDNPRSRWNARTMEFSVALLFSAISSPKYDMLRSFLLFRISDRASYLFKGVKGKGLVLDPMAVYKHDSYVHLVVHFFALVITTPYVGAFCRSAEGTLESRLLSVFRKLQGCCFDLLELVAGLLVGIGHPVLDVPAVYASAWNDGTVREVGGTLSVVCETGEVFSLGGETRCPISYEGWKVGQRVRFHIFAQGNAHAFSEESFEACVDYDESEGENGGVRGSCPLCKKEFLYSW